MYGSKRVLVRDLNPHILCALCGGYLIQATTVIECLHSFCRSCIVKFLETSKVCPICDAQIHKTRPLLNIRPDQTLQSLVYKLVPGLFQDEMRRRREFHATLPDSDLEDLTLEERGEAKLEKEFKQGDDHVSLILQLAFRKEGRKSFKVKDTRYLLCPSEVTIRHLKRFIKAKFDLGEQFKVEMFRGGEELTNEMMLQDVALIYSWRGDKPMCICYTVTEKTRPQKVLALPKPIKLELTTQELISPQSCRKNSTSVKPDLDSPDLLSETLTACHLSSPTSCSIVSDSSSETCLSLLSSNQESYEDSFATPPQKTSSTERNKTSSVVAKAITAPTSATPKTITAPTAVATKNIISTTPAIPIPKFTTAFSNTAAMSTKTNTDYKTTTAASKTTATTKTTTASSNTTAMTTKTKTDYKTTIVAAKTTTATAKTTTASSNNTAVTTKPTADYKTTAFTAKTTTASAKTTSATLSTVSSSPIKPQTSPVEASLKILASISSLPTSSPHKDILNPNRNAITENHDKSLDLVDSTIKYTQHSVQSILSRGKKKSHQNVDLPLSWKPVVCSGMGSITSQHPDKTEDILLSSSVNVCKTKLQSKQNNTQIQADKLVTSNAQSQVVPGYEKAVMQEKSEWNRQEKLDCSKRLKDRPSINQGSPCNQGSTVNQGSSVSQGPPVNQCEYLDKSKSTDKINSPNKANSKDREASVKNSSKLFFSKPDLARDRQPPEIMQLSKRVLPEGRPQKSCKINDQIIPSHNLNPLVQTNTAYDVLTNNSEISSNVLVKLNNALEDDNIIFASYIPKFQRHRKFSSIKRSLSCEVESPSAQSDHEHSMSPGFEDSMEKRNWKKRKLSTMDFDSPTSSPLQHDDPGVNRKALLDSSKPTSSHQEAVAAHNDPYAFTANDVCTLSELIPVRQKISDTAKGSATRLNQTSLASSVFNPSANHSHMVSPQNGLMIRGPKLETTANGKVSDSSLFKAKDTISKGKLGQAISTNTLTVYKDRSHPPLISSAKASRHVKKNCSRVPADDKVAKSRHSNPARPLSEISVDISSSPSDASSVTSPATDVTSPGTEDRTDSSALPDMAAPCDNDCVSTYQGRGVPLDLSSKRKK